MNRHKNSTIQVILFNRNGVSLREIMPYYSSFYILLGGFLSVYRVKSNSNYSVALLTKKGDESVKDSIVDLLVVKNHSSVIFLRENPVNNSLMSLTDEQKNEIEQLLNSEHPQITLY